MTNPTITFETKCWEKDWKLVMRTGRLRKMIRMCRHDLDERILYINNVENREKVLAEAYKYIKDGTLTSAVFVDDLAQQALDFFEIDRGSFKGGYYYSIQELAGIYNCRTDYLMHFSGDSMITNREPWIDAAIGRMEADKSILVANPNWDRKNTEAKAESLSEDAEFFRGFGFSDQCYLIRAADFKKRIYNEKHEASRRYPDYAGEIFEKRVDSYMRNHNLQRITSMKAFYRHQNFPRDPLRRALVYLTGINLKKGR
jgi:hypothetical protein